ncbi:MAG: 16S rRNA (uracil(1498)-N(3))-methyltransferase [Hyphomonadaceae bacterium]|nr:16S rRNA (uracil(1498)-N(3))-methyltransferase [Hyphomonadaceae bacterium]
MPDPRFHLDDPITEGAQLRLGALDSRHVGTVLRLGIGASVRIFNARDGEWRADIDAKDRNGIGVRVRGLLRPARPSPDLDLLFAPVKRDATDLIVEKATELGVRRLRPIITMRTITETVRADRLAAITRGAAAQTERFDIPEILPAQPLAKALDGWDAKRPLVFADEAGDDANSAWGGEHGRAPPLLASLRDLRPQALAVLIGPEGGFDTSERRLLRALPHVIAVSLGPRILRAETAAIAALALVQAAWGDWS